MQDLVAGRGDSGNHNRGLPPQAGRMDDGKLPPWHVQFAEARSGVQQSPWLGQPNRGEDHAPLAGSRDTSTVA